MGGIAGRNEGEIIDCTSRVTVTGNSNVGGIAGSNGENASISESTNTGDVTGKDNTGGIAGSNEGNISNSTNAGEVTGTNSTGGIAGNNEQSGRIENVTDTGNVTGNGDNSTTGAIAGENKNPDSDAVTGYYKQTDTVNKDLTGIGGVSPDPEGITHGTGDTLFTGSGTVEDPYKIATKEDLEKIRGMVNAGNSFEGVHFTLTADIELSGSETSQWKPIGTYTGDTDNNPFAGIFDGNGHTIKGLYINDVTADNVGLFGYNTGVTRHFVVDGKSILFSTV